MKFLSAGHPTPSVTLWRHFHCFIACRSVSHSLGWKVKWMFDFCTRVAFPNCFQKVKFALNSPNAFLFFRKRSRCSCFDGQSCVGIQLQVPEACRRGRADLLCCRFLKTERHQRKELLLCTLCEKSSRTSSQTAIRCISVARSKTETRRSEVYWPRKNAPAHSGKAHLSIS